MAEIHRGVLVSRRTVPAPRGAPSPGRGAPGKNAQALGRPGQTAPTSLCPGLFTAVATACRALGTALGLGLGRGRFMGSSISSSFPRSRPTRGPKSAPRFWGGKEPYPASFLWGRYFLRLGPWGKVTGLISEREGAGPRGGGGRERGAGEGGWEISPSSLLLCGC